LNDKESLEMKESWSKAFEKMAAKAAELNAKGVMAIAEKVQDGSIKMELKTLGNEFNDWGNIYAVACCKIMQMVRTGSDSGQPTKLVGEFDFVGGTVRDNIYVAFSGSTGEIDLEIAKAGLQELLAE
jgi:hypothetical protein